MVLGITRIKEYRNIYLKKVYPDDRNAKCLFSKQNSEHNYVGLNRYFYLNQLWYVYEEIF